MDLGSFGQGPNGGILHSEVRPRTCWGEDPPGGAGRQSWGEGRLDEVVTVDRLV